MTMVASEETVTATLRFLAYISIILNIYLISSRISYGKKYRDTIRDLEMKLDKYKDVLRSKNIRIRHEMGIRSGYVLIKKEQYKDLVKEELAKKG